MAPRIVVFGATGYTGELTARALVARGASPVLAARNAERVARLAAELDVEHVVADVERPSTVTALVTAGDVLVSTVGPFARWGEHALVAALSRRAHYLDSTGEPPFLRDVFGRWGPRAAQRGIALLPAMGYDYVPGNLAAALALADAAPGEATGVDVGYFTTGPAGPSALSSGTRASLAGILLEPGFAYRDGTLVTERAAATHRAFRVDGAVRRGVSVGGTEHLALPVDVPGLRDVGVYLGWFDGASPLVSASSVLGAALARIPGVPWAVNGATRSLVRGSRGGPDADARAGVRTLVVAEATDPGGRVVGRARLAGPNPYALTADLLAWAATEAAAGRLAGSGALGPVTAFGLAGLTAGAASCGLLREG